MSKQHLWPMTLASPAGRMGQGAACATVLTAGGPGKDIPTAVMPTLSWQQPGAGGSSDLRGREP